jgi:hypothetical protein
MLSKDQLIGEQVKFIVRIFGLVGRAESSKYELH